MTTISTYFPTNRHEADRFDPDELVVSRSADPGSLRRLLESLVDEDCVHSWRNFGPDGTADDLLRWENERRPTELFFFYLKHGGQMVAAGAVADKLTRDFPHSGYCVIGRCCIMPEYRSRGFYRRLLQYRLEHCREKFGNALNAIHIGAVSERISRVITNHGLAGWPKFIHLGEEALSVAGEIRNVGAYLLLMPRYVRRILDSLAGADAPECVRELRETISRLESETIRDIGMTVKETYEEARGQGWFNQRDAQDIEQLLLFCRSIPVVGFQ